MKQAVIYGAGNIGRGLVGQLFARSGCALCFVDVDAALVEALNRRGEYPVRELLDEGCREELVPNARAIDGRDLQAVAEAVAGAELMATAVGVGALPLIAGPLAMGLARRFAAGGGPLNILLCENMLGAGAYLRALIGEKLPPEALAWFEENIGLAGASVGRTAPLQTEAMRDGDPLRLCVEGRAELPVDAEALRGGAIPAVEGMFPVADFAFYIERKLFVHNMGHAVTAYLGALRGYTFIWEAIADPAVRESVHAAMRESAAALGKRHGRDSRELEPYIDDLLRRFGNRQLGDTIARVGRDLPRKLSENDRLFGAARLCAEQGIKNAAIRGGIGAALLFEDGGRALELDALRKMADVVVG